MKFQLNNKNLYVTGGVFGLIILFLALFLVWPLWNQIQNSSGELSSIKSETAGLQIQNSIIEGFKKDYPNYQKNLEAIATQFTDPQNPVGFITFLETTAKNAGLAPQVSLIENPTSKNSPTLSFQLVCSGSYEKILQFAEALENGPYLAEIESMNLKGPGNVDATFVINAFTK